MEKTIKPIDAWTLKLIVLETKDAYSFNRYGETAWTESAKNLHNLGYSNKKIVEILRSKIMRWAADCYANQDSENNDVCDGMEVVKYHNQYGKIVIR